MSNIITNVMFRKDQRAKIENDLRKNSHMKLQGRYHVCFHQLEELKKERPSEGVQAALDALMDDWQEWRDTPLDSA